MRRISEKSLERAAKILGVSVRLLKSRLGPRAPAAPKELLRVGEVARMLGCHRSTVLRWTAEGAIAPLFRHPGKGRRYRRADVERYARELKLAQFYESATQSIIHKSSLLKSKANGAHGK